MRAISLAALLLCSLSLALTGSVARTGEERTGADAPFVLKPGEGSVDRYRSDGCPLQALPHGGDEPNDGNREYSPFIQDMDSDGFPDSAVPVYNSNLETLDGIRVMDALIRIKKVVSPEKKPFLEGRVAYRYDGIGQAAGKPVLLFSFGGDSREKFTAERHFAVDVTGAVYEMNVSEGDEYWRWEDRVPVMD